MPRSTLPPGGHMVKFDYYKVLFLMYKKEKVYLPTLIMFKTQCRDKVI